MFNLRSLDLNLLTVFEAIYEIGTVSAAADRLALSQSATSHALSRLKGTHVGTNSSCEPTRGCRQRRWRRRCILRSSRRWMPCAPRWPRRVGLIRQFNASLST
jgi:hypothetical protein